MVYCIECGTIIEGSAKFCGECGTEVVEEADEGVDSSLEVEDAPLTAEPTTDGKRKITLGGILSWIVGIPLLLTGVILLIVTPLAGIVIGGAALILVPYSRNIIESTLNIELSRWLILAILIIALPVSGTFILGAGDAVAEPEHDVASVKAGATTIEYDELLRNVENYEGEPVTYVGEVDQVIEQGNGRYALRIMVTETTYGYTDDVYVTWEGDRVIEGDVIQFWGVVEGPKTYETVLGAQRTIPEITAVDVNLAE